MILRVNYEESAALCMHMAIMRQSVRNMLKKRYKAEKKQWLAAYDYSMQQAQNALQSSGGEMHLNIRDLEMLQEFIRAYQDKIVADKAIQKVLSDQEKQSFNALKEVESKCKELMC